MRVNSILNLLVCLVYILHSAKKLFIFGVSSIFKYVYLGGMPGGAGGGGMPGGAAGGGMPDLSALFSDPELMAAMQVSAAFIICRLRVVGLSQFSSKTYSYKTRSIFRTLSNMFPGIVFAKIVNSLKSLIIYV